MAIRKIREIGDEVLTKVCKEVTKMTPRTTELIDDMLETMYEAMGGTAGWNPQKNRCHRYRRRSGCHDQPTHRREQRRADRGRRMS